MSATRLLIIEDDPGAGEALSTAFRTDGYEVVLATDGLEARQRFADGGWDVILTDIVMEGVDGLTLLREFVAMESVPPIIVMTAYGSVERAVQAMKDGAHDFLEKPLDLHALRTLVRNAVAQRRKEPQNKVLRARIRSDKKTLIPGSGSAMLRVIEQAKNVARTNASVLIQGESGTGKELIARLVHTESMRVDGPMIAVNCAGLTESIIESELFGHEKGAFTGAVRSKKGKFELADGGTIFLDEIGEIPLAVQVKLLRVLQEREVERVGGEEPVKIDVRLICATHRTLEDMVKEGTFREDLYYRIKVIVLKLPSLRERPQDIPELIEHFRVLVNERNRRSVKGFTDAAIAQLQTYSWPGNVRELENIVEQAVVLSRGEIVDAKDLPAEISGDEGPQDMLRVKVGTSLAETEKELILETLKKVGGNKTQAAKLLGIGVRTLYRKLEEYEGSRAASDDGPPPDGP